MSKHAVAFYLSIQYYMDVCFLYKWYVGCACFQPFSEGLFKKHFPTGSTIIVHAYKVY